MYVESEPEPEPETECILMCHQYARDELEGNSLILCKSLDFPYIWYLLQFLNFWTHLLLFGTEFFIYLRHGMLLSRKLLHSPLQVQIILHRALAGLTQDSHPKLTSRKQLQEDIDGLPPLSCERGNNQVVELAVYASLLKQCGDTKALSEGKRVHMHIIESGYVIDTFLGNRLVQMYGNCGILASARSVFDQIRQPNVFSWTILTAAYAQNGHLADARSLFEKMPMRNLVSWNAVITEYARDGQEGEALVLFRRMLVDGMVPNEVTFMAVLDAFSSPKVLAEAKAVHDSIVEAGSDTDTLIAAVLIKMYGKCGSVDDARCVLEEALQPNVVVCNAMVAAYAQNGHLQEAKSVFDKMPVKNTSSWTVMISAYAQNGNGREALQLFRHMCLEGTEPDKVTFVSVVDACANIQALADGKLVHSYIVQSALDSNVVVGTALVSFYGKCGFMEDAKVLFEQMPERNTVSWNTMIAAYGQNGYPGEARSMFEKMSQPNVVSWNAMIAAYAQNGYESEAIELFQKMDLEGVHPNRITFISTLDACAELRALETGGIIHKETTIRGLETDIVISNALVNLYGKCGCLQNAITVFEHTPNRQIASWNAMIVAYALNGHVSDAWSTFERMLERNLISWNAMISAFNKNGLNREALELFQKMDMEGVKPDKISFISSLEACASLAALTEGKFIHERIINRGWKLVTVIGNALVHMYCQCGNLEAAKMIFDEMPEPSVVSWTAMIAAYAQNGHTDEAASMFEKMPQPDVFSWNSMIVAYGGSGQSNKAFALLPRMDIEGVTADSVIFGSMLDVCASIPSLVDGTKIHNLIVDNGFQTDPAVATALVNMYGKCGYLQGARNAFEEMPDCTLVPWTCLMAAYAQNGHGNEAIQLFQAMNLQGVEADEICFHNILSGCSHAGLLSDACHFFSSLVKDYEIAPTVDHYLCILDLLGRTGKLSDAEDLISNMPFEPDDVAWMIVLGACRVHGDLDRGRRAAERLMELDSQSSSSYVLLSNMYSATRHSFL